MSESIVLDASALLALLNEENGYHAVEKVLPLAMMSAVNVSEVIAVLANIGIAQDEAERITLEMVERIIPFDVEQACIAASLRKQTKSQGLSLGDRACLGLAKLHKLPVITADKVWAKVRIEGVRIQIIR
jgi:ribonuclease VapC